MSENQCDLHVGNVDGADEIYGFKSRIGKKSEEILCDECARPIAAGTEHEIATGEFCDGDPFEVHVCMDCYHLAKGLSTDGRFYGRLWNEMEDDGGENGDGAFEHFTTGCLARIETASAKAYVSQRFRQWKGLDKTSSTKVKERS